MTFDTFNTYGDAHDRAFEALGQQLFDRWSRREYKNRVNYFTTVAGAGGDGGVEAYVILDNDDIVGLQCKWFRTAISPNQIGQIRRSIDSAMAVRPDISRYIVCLPRDFASSKIGKGKVLVDDCEEKRLNDLLHEVERDYKGLTLEFWNEYRIREELQVPGNEGIFRFWFQKEELSLDLLRRRFNLAKAGWLKERYVPSLHCQGKIHDGVDEILFTPAYRAQEAASADKIVQQSEEAVHHIDAYLTLAGAGSEFKVDLLSVKDYIYACIVQVRAWQASIHNGIDQFSAPGLAEPDISTFLERIQQKKHPNPFRNVKLNVTRALQSARRLFQEAPYVPIRAAINQPHHLIFFGGPGTGKTHGIASAVEDRLNAGLPALIISAAGSPDNNWAAILQTALGGLTSWSDGEIFSALESYAIRCDISRALTADQSVLLNEPTRILICLDGIDEATDPSKWRIRIAEAQQWLEDYPRVRFAVTSRSYPAPNDNPCRIAIDNVNRRLVLPQDGDVPLSVLVRQYFKELGIALDQAPWLQYAFENALALKLFCEQFGDDRMTAALKPVSTGLAFLLKSKLERIEEEFNKQFHPAWSATDQVIRRCLLAISEQLSIEPVTRHDTLCNQIVQALSGIVDRGWAGRLVDCFTEHAVLLKQTIGSDDGILPDIISYSIAYQSYLDYFLAIKASSDIVSSAPKSVPALLKARADYNSLRLTATILLIDHGILVGEDGYWEADIAPEDLQQLQADALRNAPDKTVLTFLPLLKTNFHRSVDQRNAVLFNFLLPNLHRKELNLGITFLHDALIRFPTVLQRDIFWSGPFYFDNDVHKNIGNTLIRYTLQDYQEYDDLPLVFAWSLATTQNAFREHVRSQLTKWGHQNPQKFVLLLNTVFSVGDPQMQEDLASILHGIACLFDVSDPGLVLLADWVDQHIFAPSNIVHQYNSVIRHSARILVERAFVLGNCDSHAVDRARPPYTAGTDLLPIDIVAASSGQEEFYPIVHDLAWYVLKEAYEGFLDFEDGPLTNVKGEALLEQYRVCYSVGLTPNSFALGAAIAFMKQLGLDHSTGAGMTAESHGSLSKQATLEEKYTWLAVRMIQGYLADRLPFTRDSVTAKLTDYNLIVYKPNPVDHDLADPKGPLGPLRDAWYIPEEIAPALSYTEPTLKSDIKAWVNRLALPDFRRWIEVGGLRLTRYEGETISWRSLYMRITLAEQHNIAQTRLSMICCLVEKEKLPEIIRLIQQDKKRYTRFVLDDTYRLCAVTATGTYSSVKDVVLLNWIGEEESTVDFRSGGAAIPIHKTVTRITENTLQDGETYYKIPSKLLREGLAIENTDKVHFHDKSKELTALFYTHGKDTHDNQEFLLIDGEKFGHMIETKGVVPFWIVHQHRRTTTELTNTHDNFHAQNSKLWIVWQEAADYKGFLFHDDYFSP